jgi:hypothetical protein
MDDVDCFSEDQNFYQQALEHSVEDFGNRPKTPGEAKCVKA